MRISFSTGLKVWLLPALWLLRKHPEWICCWKDYAHGCVPVGKISYAHAWTKTSTVSVSRRRYGGCNVGWRGKIPNRRVLSSLAGSFTYLIQQISRHPPICFLYPSLAPFRLELRGSSDFRGMRCWMFLGLRTHGKIRHRWRRTEHSPSAIDVSRRCSLKSKDDRRVCHRGTTNLTGKIVA